MSAAQLDLWIQPQLPLLLDSDAELMRWLATVEQLGVRRELLQPEGTGYDLVLGTRRRVRVRTVDGTLWVVDNVDAGIISGMMPDRAAADRLAMRIIWMLVV